MLVTSVELLEDDGPTTLIGVETAAGMLRILGECPPFDRNLRVGRAHIEGLSPGRLGRSGLNRIAQAIMEAADVDTLEVHGSTRPTGRYAGRRPKPFFARRHPKD